MFNLKIPKTIRIPTEPQCKAVKCLIGDKNGIIPCSSEQGRIVITFTPKKTKDCGVGSKYSF